MQAKYNSQAKKLLQEWLESHNITISKFARMMDMDYSNVWQWVKGTEKPSLKKALMVEALTDGQIKCSDWTKPVALAKKPRVSKAKPDKNSDQDNDN